MADQEIAKHTKKVYKVWTSKEHSFKHKLQEFLIEIFIIIFAVSLSIWFHSASEKSHDREEAKIFLEGLKKDLIKDSEEMKNDYMSFGEQKEFYDSLITQQKGTLDTAYLNRKFWVFSNETFLVPNISRFEALKYSGKMSLIKNNDLLDEIINLYEEKMPQTVRYAQEFNKYKNNTFGAYLESHQYYLKSNRDELYKALKTDKDLRYYPIITVRMIPNIQKKYQELVEHNEKLIKMIEVEIK
jgi:hypothetical protein